MFYLAAERINDAPVPGRVDPGPEHISKAEATIHLPFFTRAGRFYLAGNVLLLALYTVGGIARRFRYDVREDPAVRA